MFQTDPNEAVSCLLKAIDIYTDMGRFTMAAKHHQSIAEMYENEANDLVSWTFWISTGIVGLIGLVLPFPTSNAPFNTMSKPPITSRAKSRPVRPTSAC